MKIEEFEEKVFRPCDDGGNTIGDFWREFHGDIQVPYELPKNEDLIRAMAVMVHTELEFLFRK